MFDVSPSAPVVPAKQNVRTPRDINSVELNGGFLGDWQAKNTHSTIPHCISRLETSGALNNFRRLIGESSEPFVGEMFADSDLYKTLEALGWEAVRGVRNHDDFVSEAFRLMAAVQEPDGYLNTYYQSPEFGPRLTDLRQGHEFYTLGHMIQAAIAWSYAGDNRLLDIALRFVELIHTEFGRPETVVLDGHPQIETALVELARLTSDGRHRDLARLMIELRGNRSIGSGVFGENYYQDTIPIKSAQEVTGHVVRQLYLLTGAADLELDSEKSEYSESLTRLWEDAHYRKMYLTGGMGSRHRGEAFGDPYELPADRAYSESCAAIANLHWNWRMLLLTGEARYADEMERGLYNAIASSTSVAGTAFFYSNPLQLRTGHGHEEDAPSTRLDWYGCACCPPNIARLLASIGAYLTTETEQAIQFHLYTPGNFELGNDVTAEVSTNYPWEETVSINLSKPSVRTISLRVPSGVSNPRLMVDGQPIDISGAGYIDVAAGAQDITLVLPPAVELVQAHPWVDGARASFAVRRGPVYYCVEDASLPSGLSVEDVVFDRAVSASEGGWNDDLGVPELSVSPAYRRESESELYSGYSATNRPRTLIPEPVTAVPYFRWANREIGAMKVWLQLD